MSSKSLSRATQATQAAQGEPELGWKHLMLCERSANGVTLQSPITGFLYQSGKRYRSRAKCVQLCKNGFHQCPTVVDALAYYHPCPGDAATAMCLTEGFGESAWGLEVFYGRKSVHRALRIVEVYCWAREAHYELCAALSDRLAEVPCHEAFADVAAALRGGERRKSLLPILHSVSRSDDSLNKRLSVMASHLLHDATSYFYIEAALDALHDALGDGVEAAKVYAQEKALQRCERIPARS